MEDLFGSEMFKSMLGVAVRAVLKVGGTWLVAQGFLENLPDDSKMLEIAGGVVAIIIGILLGIRKQTRNEKKIQAALELPPGTPRKQVEAVVDKGTVIP